jgi:hypothetical protein
MKPPTRLRTLLLTSVTPTALLSASATSNLFPSGEMASELGVEAGGEPGNRFKEICSMASNTIVLITEIRAVAARHEQARTVGRWHQRIGMFTHRNFTHHSQ